MPENPLMNKTDYKRLGDYIREVGTRNRDLTVTRLLGVSVSKEFIPSIANTIGTDMSSYKIVRNQQLVYIPDTSRRGDKIAIALLSDGVPARELFWNLRRSGIRRGRFTRAWRERNLSSPSYDFGRKILLIKDFKKCLMREQRL